MGIDSQFSQWSRQVSQRKLELARTGIRVWEGYAVVGVLMTILAITVITFPLIMPVLQTGNLEAVGAQNGGNPPVYNQTTTFYSDFGQNVTSEIKMSWKCRSEFAIYSRSESGYRCDIDFNWPKNHSEKVEYERFLNNISNSETELEAKWTLIDGKRTKTERIDYDDFDTYSSGDRNWSISDNPAAVFGFEIVAPRPAGKYVLQITVFPGELNQGVRVEGRSQSKVVYVKNPNGKSPSELQKINVAVGLFVLFTAWFSGIQTLATLFDRIMAKSNQ